MIAEELAAWPTTINQVKHFRRDIGFDCINENEEIPEPDNGSGRFTLPTAILISVSAGY